jgi:hypothetical protein
MIYDDNDNKFFVFKELDFLPKLPSHICDTAIIVANQKQYDISEGMHNEDLGYGKNVWFRRITDLDGSVKSGRPNIRYPLDEASNSWISENICKHQSGSYVNINYQNSNRDGTTTPLHTDLKRDYVLIYLIQSSNEDQYTKFWKENGKPLLRDRGVFPNNWDNCEEICEAKFEYNKWYLMRTNILHSIHNILGNSDARISIHVELKDNPISNEYWNELVFEENII